MIAMIANVLASRGPRRLVGAPVRSGAGGLGCRRRAAACGAGAVAVAVAVAVDGARRGGRPRRVADRGGRQAAGRGGLLERRVGLRAHLLEAKQDDRDVVAAAGLVGGVDQRAAPSRSELAARRISSTRDSAIIEVRPSLQSRKTSPVARRATSVVSTRTSGSGPSARVMIERCGCSSASSRGELAAAAHLLDERVVLGQPDQLAVAQPVGARVADVGDRDVVLADVRRGDRRAHAGALLVGAATARGCARWPPGRRSASPRSPAAAAPSPARPRSNVSIGGLRGDLARLRAAHAVGDDEERGAREVGVLVRAPRAAGVRCEKWSFGDAQHAGPVRRRR